MSGPRPSSASDACSVLWDTDDLPAAGSASAATFWVALEQNGPWGRDAVTESHLDPRLGAELARRCADAGGRLLLIREPGSHADHDHVNGSRQVLVAGGLAGAPYLLSGALHSPEELLDLPFDELAEDAPEPVVRALPCLAPTADAALLVCTNGRRDVCCAVRGRPIALSAAADRPGQVWECSHTGGHRFAPTAITLPSGHTWARLTEGLALEALDGERDGRIPASLNDIRHLRGRSCLPPPVQAAETWWREREQEARMGGLSWTMSEDSGTAVVRLAHLDGRTATVRVAQRDVPGERRDSCSKALGPTRTWRVEPS